MLEIDGAQYSGSGTIVRQAVALAALTGRRFMFLMFASSGPSPGCSASTFKRSKRFVNSSMG